MQRRVVCIEDEHDMIDLMSLIVEREGLEFIGAERRREGLETVEARSPILCCST